MAPGPRQRSRLAAVALAVALGAIALALCWMMEPHAPASEGAARPETVLAAGDSDEPAPASQVVALAVDAAEDLDAVARKPAPSTPGPAEPRSVSLKGIQTILVRMAGGEHVSVELRPVEPESENGLPKGSVLENEFLVVRYEDGALKEAGPFYGGVKQGAWTYWYEDGRKKLESAYVNGMAEGRSLAWHDNGVLRADGNARAGMLHGVCTFWDREGNLDLERSGRYIDGKKVD